MFSPAIPILILGPDSRLARACADAAREVSGASTELARIPSANEIQWSAYSVILVQIDDLPSADRLSRVEEIRRFAPCARLIVLTAAGNISEAVHVMRLGGEDYLALPLVIEDLKASLLRALGAASAESQRGAGAIHALSLAYMDEHTGLPNARYLSAHIESRIARHQMGEPQAEFALLFLDIDHFKSINDRFGHLVGNEVLRQFGQFLRATLRDSDRIFRYAGDEFVIVVDAQDRSSIQRLVTRLREQLAARPFEVLTPSQVSVQIHLEISVGVVLFPEESQSREDLLACADSRLYDDKRSKENVRLFPSDMLQSLTEGVRSLQ